ncbi:hypothetical protein [Streptomyces qinzhouensis]|uniref:Uncharacterized protein n=1 Tax=Streptomyces qinzhouensis TaxID=2599401 RepID=A0A5B8JDB7_9ACTN|nr:hypothetical protein [Streptomyces qinzhouensis]QDY75433.1 hypothetical protein FQU76_01710 [Streptomyces qinzhouensis]
MMTGWRRGVLWAAATAAGLIVVGLTLLLLLKDLGTAGTVAGFVANTVAIVMTVLTVRALLLQPSQQSSHTQASGPGSVAAGGNIGRAVTGDGNQVSGQPTTIAPGNSSPGGAVDASGPKSVAAGGSISEAVTGDNNA